MQYEHHIEQILATSIKMPSPYQEGNSREGRIIEAYKLGQGKQLISLIGGCHADEPVGPNMLRKLVSYLSQLTNDELLEKFTFCIIPHMNPDGEVVNKRWYNDGNLSYDFASYLQYVQRELPGDDIEFGFPDTTNYKALRPENAFAFDLWRAMNQPFSLHISFHGLGYGYGPWFLLERSWKDKTVSLQEACRKAVTTLNYELHDVDREGEKGFWRLGEGFCSRPDSESMRAYFLNQGDQAMAGKFHPSSMESIRSLSGDILTMVSEMPLFTYPKTPSFSLDWPSTDLEQWKQKRIDWKLKLQTGQLSEEEVTEEALKMGLQPMPIKDQQYLQLTLLFESLKAVTL